MKREEKKIVMEEKIQEWLNVKKEQVAHHYFKVIVVFTLVKYGQLPVN